MVSLKEHSSAWKSISDHRGGLQRTWSIAKLKEFNIASGFGCMSMGLPIKVVAQGLLCLLAGGGLLSIISIKAPISALESDNKLALTNTLDMLRGPFEAVTSNASSAALDA